MTRDVLFVNTNQIGSSDFGGPPSFTLNGPRNVFQMAPPELVSRSLVSAANYRSSRFPVTQEKTILGILLNAFQVVVLLLTDVLVTLTGEAPGKFLEYVGREME
uniref:Ninjurin-1 n=1 Tax=Steinernema glaseri TaxID=37863 RepID=A0A1I8AAW9_9BILA